MFDKQILKSQPINFSQGLNTDFIVSDSQEYTDIRNLVIDNNGFPKNFYPIQIIGNTEVGGIIKGYGLLGDKLLRVKDSKIQYLLSGMWTDIITNYNPTGKVYIENFKTTSISFISIVVGADSTTRVIKASGLTANTLAGKIVKIPNGNIKMVVSNTAEEILIDGILETVPASGVVITLHDPIDCLAIVAKGENVRLWTGNGTLQTLNFTMKSVVYNHNRLFYINGNDNKVFFSEIWNTEFLPKNNFLLVGGILDSIIQISPFGEKLVIYGKNTRVDLFGSDQDDFTLYERTTTKGLVSEQSVANGQGIQFFMSEQGLENLESIDNSKETQGISLTDNCKLFLKNYDTSNSIGAIFDEKFFLLLSGILLIYDFQNSYILRNKIFEVLTESFQYIKDIKGELYIGKDGNTYRYNKTGSFSGTGYIVTNNKKQGTEQVKKFYNYLRFSIRETENLETKVYFSINNKPFELASSQTGSSYITAYIRKAGFNIKFKFEFISDGKTTNFIIDEAVLYFRYLSDFIWK